MRVAYVCADTGVPVFGNKGCSIHVQEIIRAFLRRGDTVDIFAARDGGVVPSDLSGCKINLFQIEHGNQAIGTAGREIAQQQMAAEIAEKLGEQVADSGTQPPFDLIYERYSLWSSSVQRMARQQGVPAILEVNAPLIDEQQQHREIVNRVRAAHHAAIAFEQAGTVVAVSREVADYVQQHLVLNGRSRQHPVRVVPNGVDVERFAVGLRASSRSAEECTIGFVGTLKPWHGVESLIAAFSLVLTRYPYARLVIIGDGPMREQLAQQVNAAGPRMISQVTFIGSISPTLVPEYLAKFDIAVAPYLTNDNFYFSPLKVFEYMAAGCAVVASRAGQIAEIISDERNGLLYTPGDIHQLSGCLSQLIHNRRLALTLGRAGRQQIEARHSWNSALASILESVLPATHDTAL